MRVQLVEGATAVGDQAVDLGGYSMAKRFVVEADDPKWPYRATLTGITTPSAGPQWDTVVLQRRDGEQVSSLSMRALPLPRLLRIAVELGATELFATEDGRRGGMALGRDPKRVKRARSALYEPRSRRSLNDEFLRDVAAVYRKASTDRSKHGVPAPTVAVTNWGHTTRPTASRWIRAARDRGLL